MAILSDKVQEILSKFNSYYNRIQFTCEIDNNKINFLNTTIIVENNIIKFDLYYKSTFRGDISIITLSTRSRIRKAQFLK